MSRQQLQTLVQMLRSQPVVKPDATVQEARAGFEQIASMFPVDADIKREAVDAGGVKAEWLSAPDADVGRAVLYLHGGGYVIGSINTHRTLAALSPRSRAPASRRGRGLGRRLPVDAHPGLEAGANRRGRRLGGRRADRGNAGRDPRCEATPSGGGRVPVAVGRPRRDRRLDDDKSGHRSHRAEGRDRADGGGLSRGQGPRTPLAAPLYADLTGLPPLLIQVGTAETLLDDASRLAERARKAGVAVSYEPSEDMIHVWHLFASMLDEGQQAIDRIGEFVRKHAA